jgi:hypothetical protein
MYFKIIGTESPSIDQGGLPFEIKETKQNSSKRSLNRIFYISFRCNAAL